ncbi:MAG: isocitrate lyase/phosphoenolpyruvate mutase family protein [Proteobacteria bacterium]|nr:isocitrate lyase/phosphoenolpyruvate mutase family protein [Pseudomonadota bacterium]
MPSRWTNRRQKFRAILAGSQCVHPASVHDPIGARIAHDLGFECGMFAGSTASLTVLGSPDLIVLTLSEFAQQALRIGRAADLPLMCDADHGYGNALSVMRTVEELETAGVAGLSIEDTDLPQPFGIGEKQRLLSVEEGVGKMKAALAGRRDPDLVISGRTSAPGITGIEDTIRRAKAYESAGVDAMFLVGAKSRAEVEAVAAEIKIPLILGNAPGELADKAWLSKAGVRIALQGHQQFAAAVQAIYSTLKALREGVSPADLKGIASAELMRKLTRAEDYERWSRDWLGNG